jgi:hypothetical protein
MLRRYIHPGHIIQHREQNNLYRNQYGIDGGDMHSFGSSYFENNITENTAGIQLAYNANIYRNNFINNTKQVDFRIYRGYVEAPKADLWDNGIEGNYWSDYLTKHSDAKEVNSTGTYDTPYELYPDNFDNHPLVEPVEISLQTETTSNTEGLSPDYHTWTVVVLILAGSIILPCAFLAKRLHPAHNQQPDYSTADNQLP